MFSGQFIDSIHKQSNCATNSYNHDRIVNLPPLSDDVMNSPSLSGSKKFFILSDWIWYYSRMKPAGILEFSGLFFFWTALLTGTY